ncbi:MAG: HAD family hydrolase [Planctomycetota bacterium]|jgi:phosphoglycolate phosphatase
MYELAIFDFDGTIADTFPPIVAAANEALEACGFKRRQEGAVRVLVGLPLEVVMERLAGRRCRRKEVEALCERYRSSFSEIAPLATRLFDGMKETIEQVHAKGRKLAIATSRRRPSLISILKAHALEDRFDLLMGADCVTRGKPHPEMVHRVLHHFRLQPDRAVVIGDTTFDLQMGKAAATHTCAVTWGSHSRDELVAEEPDHIVHSARELTALLACGA